MVECIVVLCKASSKRELGHKPIRVPCQKDLLHGLSRERSARFIGLPSRNPASSTRKTVAGKAVSMASSYMLALGQLGILC